MAYAGFVMGGLAFLGHSMIDMDFFMPETALFGWCVLGAALGLAAQADPEEVRTVQSGRGINVAMGGVTLILVLPLFVFYQGESLAFRAGKAFHEKDYETAASLYSDAGKMIPINGRFILDEGRARAALGDHVLAGTLFRRADSLMRASPYPSWETGRAAMAAGHWEDSIHPLEKALSRFNTSPRIRIDLALAHLNLGDTGKAIRLLDDVWRYSKFDPQARDLADQILSRLDR